MIHDLLKEIDKFSKLKYTSFENFVVECNQKKYAIVSQSALNLIKSDGRLYMIAPQLENSKEKVQYKFGNVLGCEVFFAPTTSKIEDWYFYITDQPIKIQK